MHSSLSVPSTLVALQGWVLRGAGAEALHATDPQLRRADGLPLGFPAGLAAGPQRRTEHTHNALLGFLVRRPALLPDPRRAPRRQSIPRLSLVCGFLSGFSLQQITAGQR